MTEMSDLNPFALYDAEAARLDDFFRDLDDEDWTRPTRCEGWTVRDVLAHLAGQELYNHACLDDAVDDLMATLESSGVDFNEWCVVQRRDTPVEEVLQEWRHANRSTRERMRERGRDAMLATASGPYPVGLQAFHYASELATHADDIEAPVAPQEEPGRLHWRARVGELALAEQDRPVDVISQPEGFLVRTDGTAATLPAPDFVAATVARLPDNHPLNTQLREALRCLA